MNETEWLSCTFSTPMLEHLRAIGRGTWRKRFLLALACSHRVASLMTPDGLRAVEVVERFVAGSAADAERWDAFVTVGTAMDEVADFRTQRADYCANRLLQLAAEREFPATWDDDLAAWIAQTAPEAFAWTGSKWDEPVLNAHRSDIADWVRDIFGNPFRPVAFDPAWKTQDVGALATEIDERQSFDLTSLLAEALERSGCRDTEVLSHCRMSNGHIRGCWVVDAILGVV